MKARMEHFSEKNPNPILSIEKDGTILYSNEAAKPLLIEWGVVVGDKLPLSVLDFVQSVIHRNSPEKNEIKVGNEIYLVVFHPLPEQECINFSGFDISDQKKLEEKPRDGEAREMANLELSEIVDIQAIQSLMDDFYKFAHITMALVDLKGNVLVRVGWQDICTGFHRVHPETCKHCVESDTKLSAGVSLGEFKLYKCKNNMWDIATPIMVCGQHIGNIFSGQFFFEDEHLDHELFRSQARKYGFNEEEYIAALEKVPRLSRETMDTSMTFLTKLANMLSHLSYSNIKLAKLLVERDTLVKALRESEKCERARSDELEAVLDAVPVAVYIAHDPQTLKIIGNRLSYEWQQLPVGTNFSKSAPEGERPESFKLFKDGLEMLPADMPSQMAAAGIEVNDCELDIVSTDGKIRHVLGNARPLHDEQGNIRGSISAFIDITERKKAEEALKKANETLEEQVKERTSELKGAYESLKQSEKGLAEAQEMAHIGNWEWDIATDKAYWSDELYRIFGRDPQESGATYDELLNYIHPDDRDYMDNAHKKALNGKSYNLEYRIIRANGEERTVHMQSKVICDENSIPIRLRGIIQDITESKKAEEKIRYLANVVESSLDAIGTISLDGIITSWNKGAEQIYGYSEEEILGKHVSILAPSHLKNETMKQIELIKQGKSHHQYETSRLGKDGKKIYISITYSPVLNANGKLTAISIIGRDITERKRAEVKLRKSEEKYRYIVETANEGITIISADDIVTYANRKLVKMLEYTLEEFIGRSIWNFISEESKTITKLNIEKRKQGINESYETKLIRKDGLPLWVLVSGKALFDNDGKYAGSLSMLTDITERKKAEEALRNFEIARKKELHHRIKNNLQVISSLLDLQADLFKGRKNITDSEVLKAFKQSIDRVLSIALIHEELYKGKNTDVLNFSQYIEDLANNLLKTYVLKTDVGLSFDLEDNLFFDMDIAIPLGIIINELVSNSLKYAFIGRDNGEIKIKLHREEGSNTSFVLTVSDNGIGIPKDLEIEDLDSLGLQLVTALVDQLDGELELKRDNGTKFALKFTEIEK